MSNIEFDQDKQFEQNASGNDGQKKEPKMLAMVKKIGLAQNDKQANNILLGVAGIALAGAVILIGSLLLPEQVDERYRYTPEEAAQETATQPTP